MLSETTPTNRAEAIFALRTLRAWHTVTTSSTGFRQTTRALPNLPAFVNLRAQVFCCSQSRPEQLEISNLVSPYLLTSSSRRSVSAPFTFPSRPPRVELLWYSSLLQQQVNIRHPMDADQKCNLRRAKFLMSSCQAALSIFKASLTSLSAHTLTFHRHLFCPQGFHAAQPLPKKTPGSAVDSAIQTSFRISTGGKRNRHKKCPLKTLVFFVSTF